jgi:hypothetical protein
MRPVSTPVFDLPDHKGIVNLLVERMNETTLQPGSAVLCLNRGRTPLTVRFNGEEITVPSGVRAGGDPENPEDWQFFKTEYAAAQHMQRHLIVPGTRNIEVGGFVSWIAIKGSDDGRIAVDSPETCALFTDEELTNFGEAVEAIDRKALSDPAAREATVVRTSVAAARSRTQAVGGLRPAIEGKQQVSNAAAEAAAHVFEPPAESATRQAEAEAAADSGAPRGRSRAR